jgi:hypothetical protein
MRVAVNAKEQSKSAASWSAALLLKGSAHTKRLSSKAFSEKKTKPSDGSTLPTNSAIRG